MGCIFCPNFIHEKVDEKNSIDKGNAEKYTKDTNSSPLLNPITVKISNSQLLYVSKLEESIHGKSKITIEDFEIKKVIN